MKLIEITYEHIRDGKRSDPIDCPIANGLRDAGFEEVYVCPDMILVDGSYYIPSIQLLNFMYAFDHKELHKIYPIKFDLDGLERRPWQEKNIQQKKNT